MCSHSKGKGLKQTQNNIANRMIALYWLGSDRKSGDIGVLIWRKCRCGIADQRIRSSSAVCHEIYLEPLEQKPLGQLSADNKSLQYTSF